MDYKYEQALERAQKLQENSNGMILKKWLWRVFPELKENDDERIRKEIIDFLGLPHPQFVGKRDHEKWIAWLEKQSEKKGYTFKPIPRLLDMIVPSEKAKFYCQKLIDTLTKEGYDTDAKIVANCLKQMNGEEVAMATMNEDKKQGENKSAEDDKMRREILELVSISGIDYNQYEEIKDWLEKQGENKPAENVEIKFCEGDKVVSNQDGKIYTVGTAYYITGDNICLHDTDGNHLWTNRDDLEKNYHLWTLKDAKDGDVLASMGKGGQEVGIVKRFIGKYGGHNKCFETYCYSDLDGTFRIGEYMGGNSIHPATKKQCDQLFQKMKEAGYEWDADKKELKKIEQNPAESTKDYNDIDPHFGIPVEDLMSTDKVEPKFKPGDWIVFNGLTLHIDGVVNGYYRTTSRGDGIHNSYDWNIDYAARLWTIQEAKDGDVLVDEDNNIGIYLGEKDDLDWHSCIYLGCDNRLRGFSIGGYHNIKNTKPATKKQRDLLFQKMKEAGYVWDSEKKKLKKIKVASKESEDERIKKTIIRILKGEIGYTSKEDIDKYVTWFEKQGEKDKPKTWCAEDEQNLNVVLSFIPDECLRRWLKDKLCYDTLDPDKVIEWLKNTIKEEAENCGIYSLTRLILPYNHSIEDLINDFKEDFGL